MKRGMVVGVFAALIIVSFLAYEFVSLSNSSQVYDLMKKFRLSGNIVGYGILEDQKTQEEIMNDFSTIYEEHRAKGEKVYFIFGNSQEVKVLTYEEIVNGKINIVLGNKNEELSLVKSESSLRKIIPSNNDQVKIIINGKEYDFKLKNNEVAYMIVSDDGSIKG
jgi:hypothetical protein